MNISFIDVYNPLPINSGGDWYRYQLLDDLSSENNVIEYYTFNVEDKQGYSPFGIKFKTKFLDSNIPWIKISQVLEILKFDYLFRNLDFIQGDIIFFSTVCYHIANKISRVKKLPLVLVMHNVEWQYLKSNGSFLWVPMKFYEHYIFSKVDAIIAICQKDYEYALKFVSKEKVFLIPPKINENIFKPLGPTHDYGNDKINLLFYGSLDRKQNFDALRFIVYDLLPLMKKKDMFRFLRLNVFGSGGWPKGIDLDENVNFIGSVENPGEYIRGADIVLVPMKNSGGIKIRLLESLACGKLVIATPEAICGLNDGFKKFIFSASNAEDFINIIEEIVNKGIIGQNFDFFERHMQGSRMQDVIEYVMRS